MLANSWTPLLLASVIWTSQGFAQTNPPKAPPAAPPIVAPSPAPAAPIPPAATAATASSATDATRNEREALARKIIDVSDFDKVAQRMGEQMIASSPNQVAGALNNSIKSTIDGLLKAGKLTAAQHAKANKDIAVLRDQYLQQEVPKMVQAMQQAQAAMDLKPVLYQAVIPFYVNNFTVEELREIHAYQSSATGQKVLNKTPELIGQMFPALQAAMSKALLPAAQATIASPAVEAFLLTKLK
jgi:hypothetical protein